MIFLFLSFIKLGEKIKNTINLIINSDAKISHIITKKAYKDNFAANSKAYWYESHV